MSKGAESLGDLLPEILKKAQKKHELLYLIQANWLKLVGKELSNHTKPISLRKGKLIIHVDHPGDNFELGYKKSELLGQLQKLTNGKVEGLIIRAGDVTK